MEHIEDIGGLLFEHDGAGGAWVTNPHLSPETTERLAALSPQKRARVLERALQDVVAELERRPLAARLESRFSVPVVGEGELLDLAGEEA